MKQLKKWKTALIFVLFTALLLTSICQLAYVLRVKKDIFVWDNYRQLEKGSIDMFFIGSSHQFCSINTDLLYEEYDLSSFMLATSAQTVPMSYYAAMEVIETHHPKAIVLEASYCANDFRTVSPEMSHYFFDGMPWTEAKKLAVEDLIEKDQQIYFYLNLGQYHNRWKEIGEFDFQSNLTSPRGSHVYEDISYNWEIPVVSADEKKAMPAEIQKYMDMLVELCKANDVELIMYTAPFNTLYMDDTLVEGLYDSQRIFNGLSDYAEEKGVRYYNLFNELDQLNLDGATDFKDSQHLNYYGQEKLTRYMFEKGYFNF